MIRRLMAAIAVGTSLLGVRASAQDKTDFDQGSNIPTVDIKGALKALPLQADASAPTSQAVPPAKTYMTASEPGVHTKGYHKHEGRKRDWKKSKDLGLSLNGATPNTLDLRPNLTQIENQGTCGGCWAFSLTATNRDGHALGGDDPGRLSMEWLIDNAKEADGCNGGDFDAADNLIAPKGEPLWGKCPFEAGASKCSSRLKPAASITAWHMLGDEASGPSVKDIETEMASSGKPVSIAVAAAAGDWEKYSGGVYNGCTAGTLDHMINIVGWDNEGAAFDADGNLPPGKGVWILRNSWGTAWGESGYMRTKMTDKTGARCNGVAEAAAYFDF